MLTEEVLKHPAKVLTEAQRAAYFEDGFVLVEGMISPDWIARLRDASDALIERSRKIAENDDTYILEAGHCADEPRLKRVTSPVTHHEDFWAFASESPIADAVSDVVGPNVKFYHSKLNYKWSGGGQRFAWHQDIQAWPHTNYSPVTVGVYLEDCDTDQGPLRAVRGSHKGELYDLYDKNDEWVVKIDEGDLDWLRDDMIEPMVGPAGTMFLLNCRTIHGSTTNKSPRSRPLLLNVFSAADAFPYMAQPLPSPYDGAIVRGEPARWAHHDPRPCQIPPDWSNGYVGPWAHQNRNHSASM